MAGELYGVRIIKNKGGALFLGAEGIGQGVNEPYWLNLGEEPLPPFCPFTAHWIELRTLF
jgi:hypothetical protein